MLKKRELEKIKAEIIKEKLELEEIKKTMEDTSKKINISNVYIFKYGNISYLVNIEKGLYPHYIAKDIFSKNIIFEFTTYDLIENQNVKLDMEISRYYNEKDRYAYIKPILESNRNLIKYVNQEVPEFVLHQLLFKLNNIDVTNKEQYERNYIR